MQTVLECKSCGGQLQPVEGARIVYCGYCGSANVFSYVDRFSLYNQANYLRQRNEFDRAISVYENIINEDPKDAEAYFGIALCKYGIEYVKDPADERMIPTCHRTRIKLFSQDEDYEKAVSLSEPNVADVYRIEAEKIDHILKGIQKLSYNQKKYDVFICYKESDENGERTRTSVIAQDVYEQLTAKGYSVFFARKTLAGMIGSDYEPVIFSALYSAKVMLVIGTRPEEFQGIWVKNEWIRFLERIAEGDECTLIPCYKEMSPYELPQEMVNIQSLDISKIGFMQDITDALERLIKGTSTAQVSDVPMGNAVGLRKRAYIFLEQGEFAQADRYFERALDIDPEDSECYWGKLLAGMSCRSEEQLCNILTPISGKNDYRVALKFANEEQSEKYRRYSDLIDEKIAEENRRKEEQAMLEKERAARAAKLAEEEAERQRILRAEEREHIEREKKRKRAVIVKRMIAVFLPLGILFAFAGGALII
ncbi:MAG: TIR domain-containing protein, partial [Lachnospiraceae bacterium]|nr:TIR domain-containing protein [Lachnospiraceae bacterium]